MNFQSLLTIIKDEVAAEEYLRYSGILKLYRHCPKCTTEKPGRIRRGRYKCYHCKAEWSIRSGSFMETTNITFSEFLLCVKLFELEVGVYRTADELGLTHKVVSKVFNHIRTSILAKEDRLIDDTPIKNEVPLLAVSSSEENIKVVLVENPDSIDLKNNPALIIGRRRTDAGKNVFYELNCRYKRNIRQRGKSLPVQEDELNRFWSYAIEKLVSTKTSTVEGYYHCLKEIEYRYNNREVDLFDRIIKDISKEVGWQK